MIGIIALGGLRDPKWDWKLLYRVAGKTLLEHTVSTLTEVEMAHKIVVCLDQKDASQVNGTAFNSAALDKSFIQSDERIKLHFSDKKDWIGKAYDGATKHGLTTVCIVSAASGLLPPGLIKECIMAHFETGKPIQNIGYPSGLEIKVIPFNIIANLYRYRDHSSKQDEYARAISWSHVNNDMDGPYYVYNGIKDLEFPDRTGLAMLDALLTDVSSGEDLSDLLKEWHEQE